MSLQCLLHCLHSLPHLTHMQEGLLAKVVSKLTLPDANLQTACTELLKNVAETKGERYSLVFSYSFPIYCCANGRIRVQCIPFLVQRL